MFDTFKNDVISPFMIIAEFDFMIKTTEKGNYYVIYF